jgi:hypothetical protein
VNVDMLDRARSPAYNCAHYAAELWERETGRDIRPVLGGFLAPTGERKVLPPALHALRRISAPAEPCLVLFRRGRSTPHLGVFIRGRVQHLAHLAPIRQPLSIASLGYQSVRFYAPR